MSADLQNPVSILVTGGAGYIGAHCCKALHERGYIPICLDNLSTGHRHFVKWGPFVFGELANETLVRNTIVEHRISTVIHFAASSQVGESVADPQKYFINNVATSLSLLNAMRATDCRQLVFSSTGAVYGDASRDPIRESQAGRPVNPYGSSKWMIEQVLQEYRRAYGFRSVCLRYFNASGAAPSGEIGEFRDPETHLIPRAMMALQGHVGDFSVFGDDYETPDGTAIRDYIHVTDLAQAHILAIDALTQGFEGGSYNLGTGVGCSVRQVLSEIEKQTGLKVPLVKKPRRIGDPAILVADPSAAREALHFVPRHSDLRTIIQSAWNWHGKAHARRSLG